MKIPDLTALRPGDVSFCPPPTFSARPEKHTRAQQAGLRYEMQVHTELMRDFSTYLPSPWISFHANGRMFWAQPDGLLFHPQQGIVTLIEIKLHHTDAAYWQLMRKYLPLVRCLFPPHLWRYSLCEVVRWYDPHIKLPARPVLIDTLRSCQPNQYHVMRLSP